MLRNGDPIGVIVVGWADPGPIPSAQEELLKTFADQAVIAIENTRLFDEIQDKTRQLERADKYKSHFLASASHDLRQPLYALTLFVAQLHSEADPEERKRLVSRIDSAVASMNELFEALLDMSKLEAGILETHIADFPVQRLLERIETTFSGTATQKKLGFSVVPSSAWTRSDPILFERILMNLASNAVRYTQSGGIVIGCRRSNGQLRIDVVDSGPGILEEQQEKIFDEYFSLTTGEPDRRGGLGLGLAIVDRLGKLLGLKIELRSRPGAGSRFSILAPLIAKQQAASEDLTAAILPNPTLGKLVLIIDDDPLVLDGMGGLLRSWGCDVMTVESGEAALLALAGGKRLPDLLISDYRLTKGTGIDAIDFLRRELDVNVPAFLISGDTAPERLRDASEKGFPLLHKPVAPMRLRTMLGQMLKSSKRSEAR
jgi:signal transduction histidine kinase/CheY-like chemotaxis protein